ncbi:MAG: SGNH/GDSL hydrolase family protein [Ignavibacteria bacterium]
MGEKLARLISLFFFLVFTEFAYSQSAHITVISPNGGEVWEANSVQTITWKSYNVSKVKIEFSWDDGYSWNVIEEDYNALSSAFTWKVSDAQSPDFLIKVSDASNPLIYDISNKQFTVFIKSTSAKRKSLQKTTDVPSDSIRIMPLGDSITSGVDKDSTTHVRGPRRTLDSLLNNAGYSFDFVGSLNSGLPNDFDRDHEGHGGWVAMPPLNGSQGALGNSLTSWLNLNPPDIVLLHIGTNDLNSSKTAASVANDVVKLLDTVFSFNPNIRVILAQIINRVTFHQATADLNDLLQSKADSLAALGRKIILVDMENGAGLIYQDEPPFSGDMSDNLHPNYLGYDKMANLWFDSLNTILPILQLKVLLQGPYDINTDHMTTSLSVPLSSPYSEAPKTVSYTIPADITDWILLQLRSTTNGGAVFSKSCFLRNDGNIIDPDGLTTNISLGGNVGNYYVVVKHRNHLAVMSSDILVLDGITTYDFTTGSGQFFGTGGAAEVESGVWGMWAGDADNDGQVNAVDRNETWNLRNQIGYLKQDVNEDGQVNAEDRNITWNNRNLVSQIP